MSTTPNMNLLVPDVGVTAGPLYATEVNNALTVIDEHDHTAGKGVPVTPSGMNISTDLSFLNNSAINLASLQLVAQTSISSDLAVYAVGADLYFNDGNGNVVRITQSGSVAGSTGSISGLSSPASASYNSISKTFVWQQDTNKSANMDFASAVFRNTTTSSFGITVSPPTLSANYSLILPPLPASQKIMTLDNSGNLSAPYSVDNSTIEISSNVIQLKDDGITSAKLADDLNLPGSNVQIDSRNPILSGFSSSGALVIVRGIVTVTANSSLISNATVNTGTGFTVSSFTTTSVSITFTNTMSDTPAVTMTPQMITFNVSDPALGSLQAVNTTGFTWRTGFLPNGTTNFHFIAIGPR